MLLLTKFFSRFRHLFKVGAFSIIYKMIMTFILKISVTLVTCSGIKTF